MNYIVKQCEYEIWKSIWEKVESKKKPLQEEKTNFKIYKNLLGQRIFLLVQKPFEYI